MATKSKNLSAQAIPGTRREKLLTEADAAEFLSLSPLTLQRWRCVGKGPRFVKLGGSVRYCPLELDKWITARITGGAAA